MAEIKNQIGEHFLLGFRGKTLPPWLIEFSEKYGLGGVILFDYDCQTKTYENNIYSPEQVTELCRQIHALPSHPLIYIDQEGGKVRRFKEKLGFRPLPSQQSMNSLSSEEQEELLSQAFAELKKIGVDINLAPVIDLNINPENPDIGKVERSYSNSPEDVSRNVETLNQIAQKYNIGLCLKHFPGLGGATVNSHWELTDISDSIIDEQLQLFDLWTEKIHGQSVLVSHGLVKQWDPEFPCSISKTAIQKIRKKSSHALLITDDLHMHGLQKRVNTETACEKALDAGVDLFCIGNNIFDEQSDMLTLAEKLSQKVETSSSLKAKHEESLNRNLKHKKRFTP